MDPERVAASTPPLAPLRAASLVRMEGSLVDRRASWISYDWCTRWGPSCASRTVLTGGPCCCSSSRRNLLSLAAVSTETKRLSSCQKSPGRPRLDATLLITEGYPLRSCLSSKRILDRIGVRKSATKKSVRRVLISSSCAGRAKISRGISVLNLTTIFSSVIPHLAAMFSDTCRAGSGSPVFLRRVVRPSSSIVFDCYRSDLTSDPDSITLLECESCSSRSTLSESRFISTDWRLSFSLRS